MPDAIVRSIVGLTGSKSERAATVIDATVEVAANAAAGTDYRFGRVPTRARIHGLSRVQHDDLASTGSPTMDFGFAGVEGNFTTDDDCLRADTDVATAAGTVNLIADHANNGRMVWELIGLSSDPGGYADVIGVIRDAATNTGGTVTVTTVFSID